MLLVHPPVAKPCAPPAGVAKLQGALRCHDEKCQLLDANVEGLLSLLQAPHTLPDVWSRRASRNLSRNLRSLRTWSTYGHLARYSRAVMDLNRLLEVGAMGRKVRMGLANYQHEELSPTRSADLLRAAENPEENPFYPYFSKRLLQVVDEVRPSLLGFSLNYLSQALTTFAMIGFLRGNCPSLPLALGGGLVTSWMRRPSWRSPFHGLVDFLVAGPGENSLLRILKIQDKIPQKIHCPPDYDSLPWEDYLAPGMILPYSSAHGCYWNRCRFCPERAEGNPHAPIAPERVIQDLDGLVQKTNPVLVHFLDNALRPALMERIIAHPPGVPWYGFARVTSHLTSLDFCLALKKSGCVMLQLGLESGDQGVLDQMEKGMDLGEASLALKTLERAGIATYAYLLFGTPAETLTEARRTLEFVARHHEQIDFLNLAIFNLPVQSLEAQKVEREEFYEGDLTLYTGFAHPQGWDRNRVRQFLDKEFKRHPAIAPILRRDPPIFTSNHAPLFRMKEQPERALRSIAPSG